MLETWEECCQAPNWRGESCAEGRPDLVNIATPSSLILRHNTVGSPWVRAFAQTLGVDLTASV
ncbi:hypothetical protein SAMN03159391_02856 [Pseudomonas sp. NFACC37-1]|nr:hypothetical protein SAMN03159391_02856 [Pseudomonas sp. NFACC37-1]